MLAALACGGSNAMRFLKESLLSFFVVGIVLSLYFVAAAAALFGARDPMSIKLCERPCHFKIATDVNSISLTM